MDTIMKETIPATLMEKLFELQAFMDEKAIKGEIKEGPYKEFCDMIVGQGEDPGIFDAFTSIIRQLRAINIEVKEVRRLKRRRDERKARVTKAQAMARALDPNDPSYLACPRCSRVMSKEGLKKHQTKASVCKEIWLGRDSTIENPVRGGEVHLQYIADEFASAQYGPNPDSDEEAHYAPFGM